jgi:hypothetical protein
MQSSVSDSHFNSSSLLLLPLGLNLGNLLLGEFF